MMVKLVGGPYDGQTISNEDTRYCSYYLNLFCMRPEIVKDIPGHIPKIVLGRARYKATHDNMGNKIMLYSDTAWN